MNEKLKDRIGVLVKLGEALRTDEQFDEVIARAAAFNPWFTRGFCRSALNALEENMLTADKLGQWLSRYQVTEDDRTKRVIGVIMAGNLPLVGFHDFLCVYISGYDMKIKLSGKDDVLFAYIYEKLMQIDPSLRERSAIVERLEGFNAVIATGSDNTNRYFEYYFRQYPKILRKNRSSVAIVTGEETDEELYGLTDDIFMYFGLGCRNVSKLYVPEGYDITRLFPYFGKYKWMHDHSKYMNNYDYNRTLLLMNKAPHLANEFIMLQENTAFNSPVSVLNYEMYKDVKSIRSDLSSNIDNIQCVVSSLSYIIPAEFTSIVKFGNSQKPELWDYADNVDTLSFIFSLKSLD
jgi:hypothetical protein